MDNIKDVVNDVVGKLASREPITADTIGRVWQSTLSKNDLAHTSPVDYAKGELVVSVDSPAWLFHLKLKKGKILKQLQQGLPELKDIRFRIGKV